MSKPQGGGEGRGGEGRGGVSSGISSDGVDRRIFLGLKFSIPGFSWVGKFGMYFVTKGKMCEGNPREIDFGSSF